MNRKSVFFIPLLIVILFEFLRVYLIMPMPGSQRMNSIDLAYFLGSNKIIIRSLLLAPVVLSGFLIFLKGITRDKIIIGSGLLLYLTAFYTFNYEMEADSMFLQPEKLVFKNSIESTVSPDRQVIAIDVDGIQKAYPIQYIGYHHQVRDVTGDRPVMVTYCTVCRTGRVFSPVVNGIVENFRLVGMDHFNALLEDSTTKSWWRQANGECIAGPLKGYFLEEIPSEQSGLKAWLSLYPGSLVMQPDEKFSEEYDRMKPYDKGKSKGSLTRRDSASWKDKSWVIGIQIEDKAFAYDWNDLTARRYFQDSINGVPVLITLEPDSSTFHVFDRRMDSVVLRFRPRQARPQDDLLADIQTGSEWNYRGKSINGKYLGLGLKKMRVYQEYLHSWETFHPGSVRMTME
jgi:hypothetical protein